MKDKSNSKTSRVTIEDLSIEGTEIADEHLQLASGGMRKASYEPASCTANNDTDYNQAD